MGSIVSREAGLLIAASVAGIVAGVSAGVAPAVAQDYPARPIRVIVPSSAGGTMDIFMRALGEETRKPLGQPFIIENRPGGNFNIGARACAEAPPDGHTICILPNEAINYNPYLFKKISYDPGKDFAPVTNPFFSTQVIVANVDLKVKNLKELAAVSKAMPGKLSYFAPGLPLAVFMEKFKEQTGADIVRVPFRGGGDTVTAVMSGTTPVAFSGMANWAPYLSSGKVTAIGVEGDKRSALAPEVPTLIEQGFRIDLTRVYFGIFAPAATPKALVERLSREIARVVHEPGFRDRHLISRGHEPVGNTPDEFTAFLTADRARAARIVKDAGVTPQ